MDNNMLEDPYVHYLKANQPSGKWCTKIIEEKDRSSPNIGCKVGIHIHVHYPEILNEILAAIKYNSIKPDLIFTYNKVEIRDNI